MELTNVKVDWNPILENYISHLETVYPDIPIRESYGYVIENLNENHMPSRIVLQGNNVAAYAYLMENPDLQDRLYAYVGFMSENFSKRERMENLVTWAENYARNRKRVIVINDVFKGGTESENFLIEKKYEKVERYGMKLKLSEATNLDEKFPVEFMTGDLSDFNIEEFLNEEYEAYRDTPDFFLFHGLDKDKGREFIRKIFSGMYGEILNRPSILIRHKNQLAGACIITDGFNHRFSVVKEKSATGCGHFCEKGIPGKRSRNRHAFQIHQCTQGYELRRTFTVGNGWKSSYQHIRKPWI
ncbi:MAG: hypothetical protein M1431_01020 [Candidatus Thermoplasmatota archaeon]|nr:hypothetical protein [Candidatus Thermoplasmatota archaeon]